MCFGLLENHVEKFFRIFNSRVESEKRKCKLKKTPQIYYSRSNLPTCADEYSTLARRSKKSFIQKKLILVKTRRAGAKKFNKTENVSRKTQWFTSFLLASNNHLFPSSSFQSFCEQ